MRITQSMITENFMRNLNYNLKRLNDNNDMLSSGKKVRRPSDDPVSAVLAMRLRNTLSGIDQYKKNVNDALTWLKNTESALANTGDILQRIRELTVQAANDTLSPKDRQAILDEVSQLKLQLLQEANTSYNNRYLFGGYATDQKPFDSVSGHIVANVKLSIPGNVIVTDDGGTGISSPGQINLNGLGSNVKVGTYQIIVANYDSVANKADVVIQDASGNPVAKSTGISTNSDNQVISGILDNSWDFKLDLVDIPITANGTAEIKLTPGSMKYNLGVSNEIEVNVIGTDVFSDIFTTVESLETAININDTSAISGMLTKLDNNISTVLKYRSQIGAKSNRLDATNTRLDSNEIDYTDLLSKTEDVDVAKTIMNLKMDENVYRASLAVGARIIQPTLVDFLR